MMRIFFVLALTLVVQFPVHAERFALLVGIGKYHVKPLSGPHFDILAMQSVLEQKWGFKKNNIKVLTDKQGTKKNILGAIGDLYKKTKSGDQVFIYLSGHGTSALDKDISTPLPTTTGAFIPIDISEVKTPQQLVEHLVVGRKDLRPLLTKLDQGGRHVFVAIDACYSGNTVRGIYKKQLQKRFLSMDDLLPARGFGDELRAFGDDIAKGDKDWSDTSDSEDNIYPYKNIYYLAASGEHEPAQDIPPELVDTYPTIDGKPHGAFSDTLIRVLNNDIDGDINKDGQIDYSELKMVVRNTMRVRGFDHTPQGLPSLAEDSGNIAGRGLFGGNRALVKKTSQEKKPKPSNETQSSSTKFRVKIDDSFGTLKSELMGISGLQFTNQNSNLELRRSNSDVLFISHAGDLVARLDKPDRNKIIDFVKYQAWVHQLVNQPFEQDFNLDLDLFQRGRGGTAKEGEFVGFSIRSSKQAHILLIDIDPQGTVSVIYPYSDEELIPVQANQVLALKDISMVRPPFGRDFVQVYAFNTMSTELNDLVGKTFSLGSPMVEKLKTLIHNSNIKKARANLELVTVGTN